MAWSKKEALPIRTSAVFVNDSYGKGFSFFLSREIPSYFTEMALPGKHTAGTHYYFVCLSNLCPDFLLECNVQELRTMS